MTGRTRSTTDNDLVKVAYASDESEAELLQGLLRTADVSSVDRRAPGFDVPGFLAAGPREVLVAASDVPVAREVLRDVTRVSPSHRRGPAETGRRACSPGCWSPLHSSGSSSASPPT
jgi:Putative prokaryotic signal transducing protein